MINAPIPRLFSSSITCEVKDKNPASPAFVIKILPPFTIYSSPFLTALVFVDPASLPASGSVRPKAPKVFPDASSGR